jgi:MFS family permease
VPLRAENRNPVGRSPQDSRGGKDRPQQRLSTVENLLSSASTVVAVLPVAMTGAVAVSLRHGLGLSLSEVGLGVSAFYLSSACFSAALGSLVQRIGPRQALLYGLFFGTLCMGGLGSIAGSVAGFLGFMVAGGIANAIVHPAVNHFLALKLQPGRLASAVGAKQAAVPVAVLLSGLSVPILALNFGWRSVFLFGAAAAALLWLAWMLHGRDPILAVVPHVHPRMDSSPSSLVTLAAAGGLAAMGGNATGVFLVTSAVAIDFTQSQGAFLLVACGTVCALVRFLAGRVVDRRRIGGMRPFALLLGLGSLGYLGLTSEATSAFAPAAILAFGGGWGWPGLFQFSVIAANPGLPATATGLTQTGVYIGAASGPLLFGLLASHSFSLAWTAMCGLALAAAALGLLTTRTG